MLEGKTILIGKEPGNGRLLVAVKGAGTDTIGPIGCVPASVSRCKPAEDVGHCQLSIDQDSVMTLTNLKPQNVTYVNGMEIITKRVTADSNITLGKDRYAVDLNTVLEKARKLVSQASASQPPKPKKPAEALSIKHLEKVWNDYERKMEEIAYKQQKRGRNRTLPILLSSASATISALMARFFGVQTLWVSIPISVLITIIYVINFMVKDTSMEDKKKAKDYLIDNYVCPHADCNHFLGYSEYKILRQNKACPYCKKPIKE